jgi:hypothetical protein
LSPYEQLKMSGARNPAAGNRNLELPSGMELQHRAALAGRERQFAFVAADLSIT